MQLQLILLELGPSVSAWPGSLCAAQWRTQKGFLKSHFTLILYISYVSGKLYKPITDFNIMRKKAPFLRSYHICSCFCHAVVDVSLSSLAEEDEVVRDVFQGLLVASVEPGGRIKTTETMKELYREAREGSKSFVRLEGPPGVGKTTSLYWLYRQLKHSSVPVMVVPFNASYEGAKDEVITKLHEVSSFVVLMDVVSPSDNPQSFLNFSKVFVRRNVKCILALSSSFSIFKSLQAINTSAWAKFLSTAKAIRFKPWNDTLSRDFLTSEMNVTSSVDELVQACKGIPALLCKCHDKSAMSCVIKFEFDTVINYIQQYTSRISLKHELDILMAAKLGVKLQDVGLSQPIAQDTMMVMSYLISIDDSGTVTPYYPSELDDCLTRAITLMWSSLGLTGTVKPDSESVVGQFFECKLPYIIGMIDNLTLRVKKVPDSLTRDITLKLASAGSGRLESGNLPLPSKNMLWRTPKSFKAIDFLAEVRTQLPTMSELGDVVLAMQVTCQSSNITAKFSKSVLNMNLGHNKVLFVMLNPWWTNFDINFNHVVGCTSGATRSSRFDALWYGQPASFVPYKGHFEQLNAMFMS